MSVTCKYLGTKLTNIKEVINKHLHIINMSSTLKNIFGNTKCVIAFRKTTSLKQIIGINTFEKKIKNSYTNQNNSENETFVVLHSSTFMLQAIISNKIFKSSQLTEELQVNCHSNTSNIIM